MFFDILCIRLMYILTNCNTISITLDYVFLVIFLLTTGQF